MTILFLRDLTVATVLYVNLNAIMVVAALSVGTR